MNFLTKPLGKRLILIGLSIHYALWWAASVVVFWVDFGWKGVAATAIEPTYRGILYVSDGSWGWGAATGILISFTLVGMTLLSVRKQRCWVVLLTHFTVLLYWLVGYVLVLRATIFPSGVRV